VDRLSPRLRPDTPVSGRQRWRDLLFLHWPVSPTRLRPLLPVPLELDTYEGKAYLGVVAFAMEGVKARGFPPGRGLAFLETNVRTYVHLRADEPGVYFFSLDASSWLAVLGGRVGYGLPYFVARMRESRETPKPGGGGGPRISYELRRRSAGRPMLRTRYRVGAALPAPAPDSLPFFLVERYSLYCARRGLRRVRVHHEPYGLHEASLEYLSQGLTDAALVPGLEAPPLVHYSPGVDVDVHAGERIA
jgi:uncharacterized protein YqjF (DUF2071 family)